MLRLCLLVLVHVLSVRADGGHDWSYEPSHGALKPEEWHKHYPSCGGKRQSPINLLDRAIVPDDSLKPLRFVNYGEELTNLVMLNDGHTLKVNIPASYNLSIIGQSLPAPYRLSQFHFHWGSEHQINGVQYPLELHLVHANTRMSDEETLKDPRGLLVVAVFFDYTRTKGLKPSVSLQTLAAHLGPISREGKNTTLRTSIILEDLLPCNKASYIRYSGSLTTPPCAEVIEFHVMTNVLPISHREANRFTSMRHEVIAEVTNHATRTLQEKIRNDRPLQQLHDRKLRLLGDMGDLPTDL